MAYPYSEGGNLSAQSCDPSDEARLRALLFPGSEEGRKRKKEEEILVVTSSRKRRFSRLH